MRELLAEVFANISMGMIQNSASHMFFGENDIPNEMLAECEDNSSDFMGNLQYDKKGK